LLARSFVEAGVRFVEPPYGDHHDPWIDPAQQWWDVELVASGMGAAEASERVANVLIYLEAIL
jgi:hypothetical protein